jgi:hypothetical protein
VAERCRFVVARQEAFVEAIEPSEDAFSMGEVVELFSAALSKRKSKKGLDSPICSALPLTF